MGAAFLIGIGIFVKDSGGAETWIAALGIALFASLVVGIQARMAFRKALDAMRSTEVELTDQELRIRNPMCPGSIRREEVTRLRYMADGIVVQTKDVRRSATIGRELTDFEHLSRQLEAWAPASAPRTTSSNSFGSWTLLLVFGSLGLLAGAFAAPVPSIAIACCVLESLVLIGCCLWVWSLDVPRQTKWITLASLLVVFPLAARAYLLITGNA